MKNMRVPAILGGAGAVLAWAGTASGQGVARYRVEYLGSLGMAQAYPFRIGDDGRVVGMAPTPGTQDFRAVVWDSAGIHEAPTVAGRTQGAAFDLDGAGVAVGTGVTLAGLDDRAFAFDGVQLRDLGAFQAHAIGVGGVIVGSVARSVPGMGLVDRACAFYPGDAVPRELATLGGSSARALDVTDAGPEMIVGVAQLASDVASHAALWMGGTVRDLGTLGGSFSCAHTIGGSRQVVGVSTLASGLPRGFVVALDSAGNVLTRAELPGFRAGASSANAINSAGDIVGTSDSRACIWVGGRARDLNAMTQVGAGWRMESATSINHAGVIVGRGYHHGIPAGFRLVPASACAADFNLDGRVNSQDFFDFLVEFLGGGDQGDFNADTLLDSQDFFDFLSVFFAGC
jgi:uncharacterized membrane protein